MTTKRQVVLVWVASTAAIVWGRGALRCALVANTDRRSIRPVQRGGHHYHHRGNVRSGIGRRSGAQQRGA